MPPTSRPSIGSRFLSWESGRPTRHRAAPPESALDAIKDRYRRLWRSGAEFLISTKLPHSPKPLDRRLRRRAGGPSLTARNPATRPLSRRSCAAQLATRTQAAGHASRRAKLLVRMDSLWPPSDGGRTAGAFAASPAAGRPGRTGAADLSRMMPASRRTASSRSTTDDRRPHRFPRPPRAVSAYSTTTATAGSTSTSSRVVAFPPRSLPPEQGDPLVSKPRGRHVRRRDRTLGHRRDEARLRTRCGRGRHRQRRPSRPLHHSLATYALYRNRGDGRFEDVTDRVGLGGDRDWPTSAAWADLDNDGDLDLYVGHYLSGMPSIRRCASEPRSRRRTSRSTPTECTTTARRGPSPPPGPSVPKRPRPVRRRDGRGRNRGAAGRGPGVVAADLDDDGLVDLFVANDTTANFLWHNLGGMKFEEARIPAGGLQRRGGLPGRDGDGRWRPGRGPATRPPGGQLLR